MLHGIIDILIFIGICALCYGIDSVVKVLTEIKNDNWQARSAMEEEAKHIRTHLEVVRNMMHEERNPTQYSRFETE